MTLSASDFKQCSERATDDASVHGAPVISNTMSKSNPSLIGSVFERKSTTSFTAPLPSSSRKTGFPTVQHRSKSAFSRNREELRKSGYARSQDAPPVLQSDTKPKPVDPDEWRQHMSRENEQRVEGMTEEEREEERREIMERFGAGVGDLLKRVRNARTQQAGDPIGSTQQDTSGSLEEGLNNTVSVCLILIICSPYHPCRRSRPACLTEKNT